MILFIFLNIYLFLLLPESRLSCRRPALCCIIQAALVAQVTTQDFANWVCSRDPWHLHPGKFTPDPLGTTPPCCQCCFHLPEPGLLGPDAGVGELRGVKAGSRRLAIAMQLDPSFL